MDNVSIIIMYCNITSLLIHVAFVYNLDLSDPCEKLIIDF